MKKFIIYIVFLEILSFSWAASAQVNITEVIHQDRPHFKIKTKTITYLFDKAGGGFSSIIDKDGLDWISFNKDSTVATYPKSGGGWFRGLPNAVFGNDDGGCGHPGHEKAISEKVSSNTISTKSKSGKWEWTWTFYTDYVVWDVTKTDPDYSYWLLYEGTVGGSWNNLADKYWGSNTTMNGKVNDFYKNLSLVENMKFQFFGDKKVNRVLYIVQKQEDDLVDLVGWLGTNPLGMEVSQDGMVVAGFGRNIKGKPSLTKPNTFRIGFYENKVLDERQYAKLKVKMGNATY
ncbi:MAG: hypothetical protein ACRCVT_13020 [Leadbetterella sp.]